MKKISQKIYCAFCKLERKVYTKKNVDWTNVALSLFAAGLLMFVIWQDVDARVMIFFVMFLALAEVFVHIRWRMALPCPHCSFDPLLYKTNREEVVRRVRARLDQVKASGEYLLRSNNPHQNLPKLKLENNLESKPAPRYLSRDV